MSPRMFIAAIAAVWLAVVAAVYLPDIGRGFVKDDFRWILDARNVLTAPARLVRPEAPDFYRPLVTASFAADYALHGLNARAYGFTNLFLYAACAIALWMLLQTAGTSASAAAAGAFAWALNPHGINMAVVWLSGRTSLLLSLCAILAALAFLRRRPAVGGLLLFGAMLSKEEAVVLPVVIAAWLVLLDRDRRSPRALTLVEAAALVMPLVVYVALRTATPALTPSTAPWFYRPTLEPRMLLTNVLQYADRSLTFFAAVTLVAALCAGTLPVRAVPRAPVVAGLVWLAGGYVLTVWVPVRSSLYAVFPSVGAALICAAAIDAARSASVAASRTDRRLALALACVLAFVPLYQHRNDRWVEPARLSTRVVHALVHQPPLRDHGVILFEDQRTPYATFGDALGTLPAQAVQLATGRHLAARIVPRSAAPIDDSLDVAARYRLVDGRVDRID